MALVASMRSANFMAYSLKRQDSDYVRDYKQESEELREKLIKLVNSLSD